MHHETVLNRPHEEIKAGLIQGAVVQSSRDAAPLVAGMQTESLPMTENSRFDIASTGKVFTALCCALLVDAGKLDPDAPFTEYLPEHILGKECKITIRDLATHSSGFTNTKPYHCLKEGAFEEKLFQLLPTWERRTRYHYSCENFILLGKIAERLSGKDLDTLAREWIWAPLGMDRTTWTAPGNGPDEVLHHFPTRTPGEHNDSDCYAYGKPLGSGSCFSTISDMLTFAKTVMGKAYFPASVYDLLCTCDFACGETRRSFGWDMSDSGRPEILSDQTIHHSGFTGQSIFVDPASEFCAVILTSRTGDWGEAKKSRKEIAGELFRCSTGFSS